MKKLKLKGKYKKYDTLKIKVCPKCGSRQVFVVLGKEEDHGTGEWGCKECKWKGKNISFQEISEDEFLKIGLKE